MAVLIMLIHSYLTSLPDVFPTLRRRHGICRDCREQGGDQISGLPHSLLAEPFDTCSQVSINTKPVHKALNDSDCAKRGNEGKRLLSLLPSLNEKHSDCLHFCHSQWFI